MIFPHGWQINALKPNGAGTYADLSHGTDRYVVGLPGKAFEVQVTVPAATFWSTPTLLVSLTVDGRSVGVCKVVTDRYPSSVFEGFVNTVKGEQRYSQFLFGKPQDAPELSAPESSGAGTSRDNNTGGLEVTIHQVKACGYQDAPQHTSNPAAGASKPVEGMPHDALLAQPWTRSRPQHLLSFLIVTMLNRTLVPACGVSIAKTQHNMTHCLHT